MLKVRISVIACGLFPRLSRTVSAYSLLTPSLSLSQAERNTAYSLLTPSLSLSQAERNTAYSLLTPSLAVAFSGHSAFSVPSAPPPRCRLLCWQSRDFSEERILATTCKHMNITRKRALSPVKSSLQRHIGARIEDEG